MLLFDEYLVNSLCYLHARIYSSEMGQEYTQYYTAESHIVKDEKNIDGRKLAEW